MTKLYDRNHRKQYTSFTWYCTTSHRNNALNWEIQSYECAETYQKQYTETSWINDVYSICRTYSVTDGMLKWKNKLEVMIKLYDYVKTLLFENIM